MPIPTKAFREVQRRVTALAQREEGLRALPTEGLSLDDRLKLEAAILAIDTRVSEIWKAYDNRKKLPRRRTLLRREREKLAKNNSPFV